jgi:hypothetical protein
MCSIRYYNTMAQKKRKDPKPGPVTQARGALSY